ncbi:MULTISPECIES: hypothetical protein [unclassified Streptomyces]|uniref:hypothetical protein n=1 Tax=unclassified Streptomyces TaxID=2593676 RepID=UPI00331B6277
MTTLQAQFLILLVLVAAVAALAGSQLALADGVKVRAACGWAGLAAAAAAFDLGALYEALDLGQGAPDAARSGAVALGTLGAAVIAGIAYAVASDLKRGRRWCVTSTAFTLAMAVLAVVAKIVS